MDVLVGIYGLVFGSFLNVIADRSETDESVLWGRSHCDFCKKPLRWFELIPLFSYILQRGRCLRCKKKLSLQYPMVELVTAISYVILLRFVPFGSQFLWAVGILSSAIVIAIADIKFQLIPDSMITLMIGSTLGFMYSGGLLTELPIRILCALGAGTFFYALWYFTKGKGMGFGDVKLSLALGLLMGFPGSIFSLYIAFLTGAFLGVILILLRSKSFKSKIAFGPFLLFGMVMAIIFERQLQVLWNIYF